MHYFYPSHYMNLLFDKISMHLPNSKICADLETVMIASEDKIIIDFESTDKIPQWVKKEQLVILSDDPNEMGAIYKFQSYLEILKAIKGQGKQMFSIVSDAFDQTYAFTFSRLVSVKDPVVLCNFSLNTETDILFDLHGDEHITLEAVETYLKRDENEQFYELTFYKSLIDMTRPPKGMILNILSILKEKYHLILNLIPVRNELDLDLICISDHLIFVALESTKLTQSTLEQLRRIGVRGKLHEIELSSCEEKKADQHQYLLKCYTDIVQDCI